jgi:hypothetical protein
MTRHMLLAGPQARSVLTSPMHPDSAMSERRSPQIGRGARMMTRFEGVRHWHPYGHGSCAQAQPSPNESTSTGASSAVTSLRTPTGFATKAAMKARPIMLATAISHGGLMRPTPPTNSRPIDPVFRADYPVFRADSVVPAIRPRKTRICGWSTPGSDAAKVVPLGEVLKLRWRGPTPPLRVTLG